MSVIEEKRKKLGWSRVQLAKKLGVSRQSIFNWETKKVIPSMHDMNRLSNTLRLGFTKIAIDYINKEEK